MQHGVDSMEQGLSVFGSPLNFSTLAGYPGNSRDFWVKIRGSRNEVRETV